MPKPSTPAPFWERLPEILSYPLRGAAFICVIVLSLFSLLSLLPGIGWILNIVLWLGTFRYAFEVLVCTAHGQMTAPEITARSDSGTAWRFLALWLLCFVAFAAALMFAGPVVALLLALFLSLFLPGSIMALALDGSFLHAINPATVLQILSRIGAPYFGAFALLMLIQLLAIFAEQWMVYLLPWVSLPLATACSAWGAFAAFHLMGYLVFQYHQALGFEPEEAAGKPRLRTRDTDLMDEAEALVADGQTDAAIARLAEEMRQRAVPIAAHELYRRLLRARSDAPALLQHAGAYLNLLLLEKQHRQALGLVRESLDADRDFTPQQPEDGHLLAQRARDGGQAQLAIDMWRAMLKRWPRDPARVDWALEVAALLAQRDQPGQARQLLQYAARGLDPEPAARIEAALARLPSA